MRVTPKQEAAKLSHENHNKLNNPIMLIIFPSRIVKI